MIFQNLILLFKWTLRTTVFMLTGKNKANLGCNLLLMFTVSKCLRTKQTVGFCVIGRGRIHEKIIPIDVNTVAA
jgi:hypothetical protein